MKKNSIFLFLLIVLLIIAGGVFWWKTNKREIKGSPDDYVIKESNEGKVVENLKAGLKFKVPEGWKVKKVEVDEGSVVLYSPDAESVYPTGPLRPPLKKGCMIEVAVIYKSMSIDEIEERIKEMHTSPTIEIDRIVSVEIKQINALRNEFLDKVLGYGDAVYIPSQDRVYSICIYSGSQEIETCNQEFNKFLDTLSLE
ncbi:hypothetical protein J7K24_02795 [bacterium]|nr:hypothetical protein [bacterium]